MTELELKQYNNLINPTQGSHYCEMVDGIIDFLFMTIQNQQKEVSTTRNSDMKTILQMMWTKAKTLMQIGNGLYITLADGTDFGFIDPTATATIARGIFETVGMFNNVFVQPQTNDEQGIMLFLWWIAGYNYRQRIASELDSETDQRKAAFEKLNIEHLTNQIISSKIYTQLSDRDKLKIDNAIKSFSYNIRFLNGEVKGVNGFQELANNAGIKEEELKTIYTYFSLYAHPSSVSVMMFKGMFAAEGAQMMYINLFNMSIAYKLLCVFIVDYIRVNKTVMTTFKSTPIFFQNAVKYFNNSLRGNDYNIDDIVLD